MKLGQFLNNITINKPMKTTNKTTQLKNNVVALHPNNKTTNRKVNHQLELIKVEQEIKSYLERVEFYIEEPNSAYIKELQTQRTKLLIAIETQKLNNNNPYVRSNTKDENKELKNTINCLTSKLNKLEKKVSSLESLLSGTKAKLDKERELRIKMHTRVQTYRQEIYRDMFESCPDSIKLDWVKELIDKDSTWGLKVNNDRRLTNND